MVSTIENEHIYKSSLCRSLDACAKWLKDGRGLENDEFLCTIFRLAYKYFRADWLKAKFDLEMMSFCVQFSGWRTNISEQIG